MLFSFRSLVFLSGLLVRLNNFSELVTQRASGEQFFTTERAASGNYVDDLEHRCNVVNVDGGFELVGHGSIIWIRERRDAETMPRLGQLDLRSALGEL